MTRLLFASLRLCATALLISLAAGCGEQETDDDYKFVPKVMTDTDKDGIPDKCEAYFGTDPNDEDTDNDAVVDGAEDHDGDGYSNYKEMTPYADKDKCPPDSETLEGGVKPDGQADAETGDAPTEDVQADDAQTDDAQAEAGGDAGPGDASDAEPIDAAGE